jgi:hypothetical protein
MRRAMKFAGALAGAVLVSACSHAPVVLGDPNPPPPPGYRVICNTWSVPLATASTACTGVIAPEDRVVLHAKG